MQEFIILFVSMSPILELRVSLPLALMVFDFSVVKAISLAVVGNILPVILLLFFFERIERWLELNLPSLQRALSRISMRARSTHRKRFENWGALALFFLTAIPLPFTGAWTAALGAFLFKIPPAKALPAIFFGIVAAAFIVVAVVVGVGNLF
ncbi:MAG: small multi-drug export protein [Candidatus Harrisonbacteria bacterium]|nr:small multi-drug export protein [Candidatus Harrisonbacteria bacterium]